MAGAIESGYKYVLAYGMLIMILVFTAKFKAGYNAIYYTLILLLFLVLVTESKFIVTALAPITATASTAGTVV